jgi:WD40 repeat protein
LNLEDATVKRTLTGHKNTILAFEALDNGDIVSSSSDKTIKIWSVETGKVKKDIQVNSAINSLEVLPNGYLVSASN